MRLVPILFLSLFNACECSFADEILTTKRQSFEAAGVSGAKFETGGGKLVIDGRLAGSTIEVIAEYRGRGGSKEEAQRIVDNLKLTMEVRGNTFYLKTEQSHDWGWRDNGYIDLTVNLPARLTLDIHDGSGSMTVSGIDGDVAIEDGSGEIEVEGVKGNLKIDDGSGSIRIDNVAKNVQIHDGSGSIHVKHVGGDVWIEDGSGSIDVTDVAGRLEVPSGGSGSIHRSEVRGEVRVPRRRS
jgi:hypothetical protein